MAKGGSRTNPYPSVLACTDGSDFAVTATYAVGLSGEQLTEFDASHTPKHTNVYAGSQLLATYDFNGATSTLHYRILDPLGTMRVQTNAFGSVEEHCFNLPFGDNAPGGTICDASVDATEHHFTGKERDAETGNDDFGARYYASTMGRWMSPDWSAKEEPVPYATMGNPQSLNLYAYVGNNPITDFDADGHQEFLMNTADGGIDLAGIDLANAVRGHFAAMNNMNYSGIAGAAGDYNSAVAQQQTTQTTSSSTTPSDPIATALSNVPGVASVTPAPDPTRDQAIGGHQNETNAVTFKTPEDKAKFLAGSSRKHLVPRDVSENGFGPGLRLPGALHAEQGRIDPRTGQFLVTAHIDRFNANNGLAPLVGHFLVDVIYGSIRYPHSAGLDH